MTYFHTRDATVNANAFPTHMHNEYEMLFFIEGNADYMIESSVYTLERYDLLFIKPRTYHNLLPRSSAPYERFVINFTDEEAVSVPEGIGCIFNAAGNAFIRGSFEEWARLEARGRYNELEIFVKSVIRPLLTVAANTEQDERSARASRDDRLKNVLDHIDSHPAENITLGQISDKFYLSPSWLAHMFKKRMGISLMQYASRKRMLYAEQLIKAGTPPTTAAEICGFDNYSTFYRQYKKALGISPRAAFHER